MEQLITVTEARQMYKSGSKTDVGNEGFLVLKNINKIYPNKVQAVYDFNLAVRRNEFIVLVGPSGCGKSTTLRMIAGLEEITSGYLYIDGVTANYLASKDRDIAMVFQNYALYPNMTVFENIAFSLEMKKTEDVKRDKSGNVVTDSVGNPIKIMRNYTKEEIRKKVFEVAEILDLGAYLDRKPKELSGGQMQRVALGRAIVRNAKLFLMDEPLSNLDAKLRVQMRSEIVKLHKNVHATTVYVTHDQTEAMTMADRIVVMKDGIVQQFDTPKNLYNHPCNVFVAGFIGTPQMNFIDATLTTCSGDICAIVDDLTIPLPARMQNDENVKKYIGKRVIYGIRCEDMHINPNYRLENGQNELAIKADLAEMMGSEVYIYSTIDDKEIIAKVRSENYISSGDSVKLYIDVEKAHLFDPESEILICD